MTSEEALALAARAERLAGAATAGPWEVAWDVPDTESWNRSIPISGPEYNFPAHCFGAKPSRKANANFIAASRTLVPDLAAEVRDLAERLALAMTFVPDPSEMSGFDDDGCDGQTAAAIRAACWLHGVPVPEHCRVSGAVERQEPKESQPAWHDRPTCFGRWISDGGLVRPVFDAEDIETCVAICAGWYGPIPERPTTAGTS